MAATDKALELQKTIVTKVLDGLMNGTAPWIQPWQKIGQGLPYNAATGRKYNGSNIFWLWMTQMSLGYRLPAWMTYKQAKELGAQVRKGETSTPVVLFRPVTFELKDKKTKEPILDENGKPKIGMKMSLRTFAVFNIDQIDDLPERIVNPPQSLLKLNEIQRHAAAEAFFKALPGKVKFGSDKASDGFNVIDQACYIPLFDRIEMPHPNQFLDGGAYYATFGHEYTHWTGHSSRHNRFTNEWREANDVDNGYAFEELVAEMGSAFLCAEIGIQGTLQHASYLTHWASMLKADEQKLFRAASAASKAVTMLQDLAHEAMGLSDFETASDETEGDGEPVAQAA